MLMQVKNIHDLVYTLVHVNLENELLSSYTYSVLQLLVYVYNRDSVITSLS